VEGVKEGKKTTEWKSILSVVVSVMAVLISQVLGLGLLDEGTRLYTIATLALQAFTALGYTGARSYVKGKASLASAAASTAAIALKGGNPDPT